MVSGLNQIEQAQRGVAPDFALQGQPIPTLPPTSPNPSVTPTPPSSADLTCYNLTKQLKVFRKWWRHDAVFGTTDPLPKEVGQYEGRIYMAKKVLNDLALARSEGGVALGIANLDGTASDAASLAFSTIHGTTKARAAEEDEQKKKHDEEVQKLKEDVYEFFKDNDFDVEFFAPESLTIVEERE